MSALALARSRRACRSITRRHARSFYFASFALPREKKDAAYAVYAFCRHADDVMDRSPDPAQAPAVLAGLREELDRLFDGEITGHAFAPALVADIQRFGLVQDPFNELLNGVGKDEGKVRMRDWPELRDYCYQVASVVGLIMARIFEVKNETAEQHAIELGMAMQLTNILRDVGEDLANDRIYLPADELGQFDLTEADLRKRTVTPAFVSMMKAQIKRAHEFYKSSESGIPMLADDGSQYSVWLMRMIYAGILPEIERNGYDVFQKRAATPALTKLRLAAEAWRHCRRARR